MANSEIRVSPGWRSDRFWSFLYAAPVAILVLVLVTIVLKPPTDETALVITALSSAVITLSTCWIWASKLAQIAPTDAVYIKGTTTARAMGTFWGLVAVSPVLANIFQVEATILMPLLESSLTGFIGIGSVLLMVGPAYKEYKEAREASMDRSAAPENSQTTSANRPTRRLVIWVGCLTGLVAVLAFRSRPDRLRA